MNDPTTRVPVASWFPIKIIHLGRRSHVMQDPSLMAALYREGCTTTRIDSCFLGKVLRYGVASYLILI